MEYVEMKDNIDKYIIANSSKIFSEGASFEMPQMILKILDIENSVDIEDTRQILKCYELINEKLKEGKMKFYADLDVKLSQFESNADKLVDISDVDPMIQDITDIVINNNLVVYKNMLSFNVPCYFVTLKDAKRWKLEKIVDKLCNKAYNLLVRLEYINMQLGKYTIEKESLYELMNNLIKYDNLVNRNNNYYQWSLPPHLYDKIRDVILVSMGYNLNRLWNSCARDGVWYMTNAVCENKSKRCFSRGYNIFINALQKKDVRTKVKNK